jgi:sugar/nucleoside kinase (ribokinase family)
MLFFNLLLLIINPFNIFAATKSETSKELCHMIEPSPYEIVGFGAGCVDLLLPVSDEFLNSIPGEKGGSSLIEQQDLEFIIQTSGIKPQLAAGGSCANTIKALANLKTSAALISTVGNDALGEFYTQAMQTSGVVPLFTLSPLPTARVLCLINPEGMRTMRFFAGSSRDLKEELVQPNYLKDVKIIHFDAYSIRNGDLLKHIMQQAKDAHVKISLDLSSFEIVRHYSDALQELLTNYVDIVFANEDEIKAFTGLTAYEGCLKLQEICPIAVVLMGPKGCLVGHRGHIFSSPAFSAHVIDTTGAGDFFASGFLHGYLNGYALEKCARLGNYLGGAITEVIGTDLSEEKWKTIRKEIANH